MHTRRCLCLRACVMCFRRAALRSDQQLFMIRQTLVSFAYRFEREQRLRRGINHGSNHYSQSDLFRRKTFWTTTGTTRVAVN